MEIHDIKQIDDLLTTIRMDYEKRMRDEDNDDEMHDDEKTSCEYWEGIWSALDKVRDELGIPESNKSPYREPIPLGEIGIWTYHHLVPDTRDNDMYFDVKLFDHYDHIGDYRGGSFWSPTFKGAEEIVAEDIAPDRNIVVKFLTIGKDTEGNEYGSVSIINN